MDRFRVGKLDAAKRQLVTAVEVYARGGDPLAVLTLAEAALGIIEPVAKHRKRSDILTVRLAVESFGPPEDLARRMRLYNSARNFLKHGDRDPEGSLELSPEVAPLLLLDAGNAFMTLTGERPGALMAFHVWFLARHPEFGAFTGTPWEDAFATLGHPEEVTLDLLRAILERVR